MKGFRGAEGHGQVSVLEESLQVTEVGIDLIGAREAGRLNKQVRGSCREPQVRDDEDQTMSIQ